jgi:TPR repeat protein
MTNKPAILKALSLVGALLLSSCASDLSSEQRLLTHHLPAAQAGVASDQLIIGGIYWQGHPKLQNHAEALRWLSKSAAQGNATAQLALGCMYFEGQGVAADNKKAFQWFEKAATNKQPEPDAMHLVGLCYRDGKGTAKNREKAVEWISKAAALKANGAEDDLAELLTSNSISGEAPES